MKIVNIFILIVFLSAGNIKAQQTGTLTDNRDGKTYKTVEIGTQWWMSENLSYFVEGCKYYTGYKEYGYIYSWVQTQKDVCPDGWRLPTKNDFEVLLKNYPGGYGEVAYNSLQKTSGFNAKLVAKDQDGYYIGFWTTTTHETMSDHAYRLMLSSFIESAGVDRNDKDLYWNVRCIKK